MIGNADALQCVYDAVDELNLDLPKKQRLEKSPDTSLMGRRAELDSIGLVNLIVAIEERIEDRVGVALDLADDRAMSQERSPFRTIGSLVDYIATLFDEDPGT